MEGALNVGAASHSVKSVSACALFQFQINPIGRCFALPCYSTVCGFAPTLGLIWKRNDVLIDLLGISANGVTNNTAITDYLFIL